MYVHVGLASCSCLFYAPSQCVVKKFFKHWRIKKRKHVFFRKMENIKSFFLTVVSSALVLWATMSEVWFLGLGANAPLPFPPSLPPSRVRTRSPPLPSLPFLALPSCPSSPLSLRSRPPYIQLGGLGSAVSSPSGSGAKLQPISNLVHFTFKIWHPVATILMFFLRINLPNFV